MNPNSTLFPLVYGVGMIVVLVIIAAIAVWYIER